MKKIIFLLFLFVNLQLFCQNNLNSQFYQQSRLTDAEVKIVSGITLIGLGLSLQPLLIGNMSMPFYRYPEISVPVTLGLTVTMSGIVNQFKKEQKKHEIIKD